jgi:hypothetical protein
MLTVSKEGCVLEGAAAALQVEEGGALGTRYDQLQSITRAVDYNWITSTNNFIQLQLQSTNNKAYWAWWDNTQYLQLQWDQDHNILVNLKCQWNNYLAIINMDRQYSS